LARLSQPDIYTTDITQQRNSEQVVKLFTSEQFKNWVSGPKIILHIADSIPSIFSTNILDVAKGRAKICIKEGVTNVVSSTELYEVSDYDRHRRALSVRCCTARPGLLL